MCGILVLRRLRLVLPSRTRAGFSASGTNTGDSFLWQVGPVAVGVLVESESWPLNERVNTSRYVCSTGAKPPFQRWAQVREQVNVAYSPHVCSLLGSHLSNHSVPDHVPAADCPYALVSAHKFDTMEIWSSSAELERKTTSSGNRLARLVLDASTPGSSLQLLTDSVPTCAIVVKTLSQPL
jgi:hypothetical protein